MNRDSVYLYWNDRINNKAYKLGILYKENNKYYFKYIKEDIKTAIKNNIPLLVPFPNINATYESDFLFPCFKTRIPPKKRPEIRKILDTYNMEEYDEFELLKRCGAKLPTDMYEFRLE